MYIFTYICVHIYIYITALLTHLLWHVWIRGVPHRNESRLTYAQKRVTPQICSHERGTTQICIDMRHKYVQICTTQICSHERVTTQICSHERVTTLICTNMWHTHARICNESPWVMSAVSHTGTSRDTNMHEECLSRINSSSFIMHRHKNASVVYILTRYIATTHLRNN